MLLHMELIDNGCDSCCALKAVRQSLILLFKRIPRCSLSIMVVTAAVYSRLSGKVYILRLKIIVGNTADLLSSWDLGRTSCRNVLP